ncbi:hypothetical protein [Virgibacillus pantothenticus]|nr:hypothetical protein [Virgibacillus pantothenticus]
MNQDMMDALNAKEGDVVMAFRDPVWRDGAIRAMTVVKDDSVMKLNYMVKEVFTYQGVPLVSVEIHSPERNLTSQSGKRWYFERALLMQNVYVNVARYWPSRDRIKTKNSHPGRHKNDTRLFARK